MTGWYVNDNRFCCNKNKTSDRRLVMWFIAGFFTRTINRKLLYMRNLKNTKARRNGITFARYSFSRKPFRPLLNSKKNHHAWFGTKIHDFLIIHSRDRSKPPEQNGNRPHLTTRRTFTIFLDFFPPSQIRIDPFDQFAIRAIFLIEKDRKRIKPKKNGTVMISEQ